jgi:hypothetical protein
MSHAIEDAIQQMSSEYQIPDATLRAVVARFVAAVHESEFKQQEIGILQQIYFSLGSEAAWHFLGWAMQILDKEQSKYVADLQDSWTETAMRLDGRMKRFRHVLERWKEERDYDDEQRRLDREDEQRKNT